MKHLLLLILSTSLVIGSPSAQRLAGADAGVAHHGGRTQGGITFVSVGVDGTQGHGHSWQPVLSGDGWTVVFFSEASDLVPGDTNGVGDVFVRDLVLGTTTRVSVDSNALQGNEESEYPNISHHGRVVAFFSEADNLVPGDTNGVSDVFVRDLVLGATARVSVDSSGRQGNGDCGLLALSADGQHVAFWSLASNLVQGDTNDTWDLFVHDLATGLTERVSVDSAGKEASSENSVYEAPAISGDGRIVAFDAYFSDLVPVDTNGTYDVFVRDRLAQTTTRVSVAPDGSEVFSASQSPSLSKDGRFVAFESIARNLVPNDTNGFIDAFVHDRETGVTTLVGLGEDGSQGNFGTRYPSISADGRWVAFKSGSSNLVASDRNGLPDVFLRDLLQGTTRLVSAIPSGHAPNGASGQPSISADGSQVTFYTTAFNFLPGVDTNGAWDVYTRRLR